MGKSIALPSRDDIAIAHKAINLCEGLSASARRVAGALLDHFNKRMGRCDPSVERLATMLGIDRTSVMRATDELAGRHSKSKSFPTLFSKDSHGGHAHCASYQPQWGAFRSIVQDWEARMRTGAAPDARGNLVSNGNEAPATANSKKRTPETGFSKVAKLQPSKSQDCDLQSRKTATQTHCRNPLDEPIERAERVANARSPQQPPCAGPPLHSSGKARMPAPQRFLIHSIAGGKRSTSHQEAATESAKRRLDTDIQGLGNQRCSMVWASLSPGLYDEAVAAELARRGAGLPLIRDRMQEQPPSYFGRTESLSSNKAAAHG